MPVEFGHFCSLFVVNHDGIQPSRGRWRLAAGLLVPLSPAQAGQFAPRFHAALFLNWDAA